MDVRCGGKQWGAPSSFTWVCAITTTLIRQPHACLLHSPCTALFHGLRGVTACRSINMQR